MSIRPHDYAWSAMPRGHRHAQERVLTARCVLCHGSQWHTGAPAIFTQLSYTSARTLCRVISN